MTIRNTIEQGIAAIQSGNVAEGERLLRIALKNPETTGTLRAFALVWLGSITADPSARRAHYENAQAADPTNPQIRQAVESFLNAQMPQPPAPAAPAQPEHHAIEAGGGGSVFAPRPPGTGPLNQPAAPNSPFAPSQSPAPGGMGMPVINPGNNPFAPIPVMNAGPRPAAPAGPSMHHMAAVIGGPRGTGTAFFIAREGLLVTTRSVVGGMETVMVELQPGRQIQGYVVRSYPEYDLAFIYVEHQVNDLIPITPVPVLPDDAPLTVISYNGQITRGVRRGTKRVLSQHWFPTDIVDVPDAGGAPILDQHHYLVGMLTRNTAVASEMFYGLHISLIRSCMETLRQENLEGGRVYCLYCGSGSRAVAAGGYYCEVCGAVTPRAENIVRFPQPQLQAYYYSHDRIACRHCNATVGFHKNACLRCGRTPSS
ncbi:MAG: trypsin-like peptidase domain-containing protein [Anaerolineae bacterium]|nr:trypsin-like peptidase domain-containing protein [Anaerolineae bacterium]